MDELMNTVIFGVSLRWIIVFLIKGTVIYLFVRVLTGVTKYFFRRSLMRVLTGVTKYFFRRSLRRQGKLILDATKVSFMQRIVVTTIYVIGIAGFLSLIPGMEKVSNSILASAGIMAMAVGLASQDALSNIVGGLFIIWAWLRRTPCPT